MIMLISLWVLCGVIAVMKANARGERDLKLLLLCSIGGPIGLVYMLTRPKKPKVFCPYCNEYVDTIGDACFLCGLNLKDIDSSPSGIQSKQCPKCQGRNVHDAFIENGSWGKWCPDCKMSIKKIRGSIR